MNDREIDFIRTALLGKNPIVEIGHSRTAQRNSSIGVVEQKSGIDKADDFFTKRNAIIHLSIPKFVVRDIRLPMKFVDLPVLRLDRGGQPRWMPPGWNSRNS